MDTVIDACKSQPMALGLRRHIEISSNLRDSQVTPLVIRVHAMFEVLRELLWDDVHLSAVIRSVSEATCLQGSKSRE